MTAIGKDDRWHLEMKRRWVDQYNFYVQDSHWGRMFVRVCPYFPFSARVCLNQHYWLALRLQERGIRFRQCAIDFCINNGIIGTGGIRLCPDRVEALIYWKIGASGLWLC